MSCIRLARSRTIYLLPLAYDALVARWEAIGKPVQGRVIGSYAEQGLKTALRRVISAAGIEDFVFHDLRHTVITRLAAAGWSPLQLAKSQGIKDARHLEDRFYSKPQASEIHKKISDGHTLTSKELMAISGHASPRMLEVYANIDPAQAPASSGEKAAPLTVAIRVRREEGGKYVAWADTPEGRLEAEGATPKEAKGLLADLL